MYLEIYPDVVFTLNLIIDSLLLLLIKIIIHKKCRILRLLSAAAIGGATAAFINLLPWLYYVFEDKQSLSLLRVIGGWIKPASLVCMVRVAFGKMNWMELLRLSILFFLVTCFAGGFLNAVYYHTGLRLALIQLNDSVIFSNIPMGYLLTGFLGITLLTVFLVWLRMNYHGCNKEIYEIVLLCEGRSMKAKGLVDTGNCLFDPISHKPVIIVEKHVMEQLIPVECSSLLQPDEVVRIQNETQESQELLDQYRLRFHLIPYRSIGKEQGILPGIVLDSIQIKVGEETCCQEKVTAAIYNCALSADGEYQVILHKGLLEGK